VGLDLHPSSGYNAAAAARLCLPASAFSGRRPSRRVRAEGCLRLDHRANSFSVRWKNAYSAGQKTARVQAATLVAPILSSFHDTPLRSRSAQRPSLFWFGLSLRGQPVQFLWTGKCARSKNNPANHLPLSTLRKYYFLDNRRSWPSKKRRCDLRVNEYTP
jgi:hypothetical protein